MFSMLQFQFYSHYFYLPMNSNYILEWKNSAASRHKRGMYRFFGYDNEKPQTEVNIHMNRPPISSYPLSSPNAMYSSSDSMYPNSMYSNPESMYPNSMGMNNMNMYPNSMGMTNMNMYPNSNPYYIDPYYCDYEYDPYYCDGGYWYRGGKNMKRDKE